MSYSYTILKGAYPLLLGAAFDVPSLPADVIEKTKKSVVEASDEDKNLLEKMQAQISNDPRGQDYLEVTLGADGAGIKVRQVLNKKHEQSD